MKHKKSIFAIAVGFLVIVGSAHAQEIKKGTLSGTVINGSALAPGSGSVVAYSAASSPAIITQVCAGSDVSFQINSTFISRDDPAVNTCTTFVPGIGLSVGDTISCVNSAVTDKSCQVVGVSSKK